jgi:hypothetical protein
LLNKPSKPTPFLVPYYGGPAAGTANVGKAGRPDPENAQNSTVMQIENQRKPFYLLLTQRAIFWQETQTLLIGDLHLGKITHFRKEGIAVPPNAIDNNFKRLNETRPKHRRDPHYISGRLISCPIQCRMGAFQELAHGASLH